MKTTVATGTIVSVEEKYGGYIVISISQEKLVQNAEPGQFVMIKPNQGFYPMLGRPFDIADVDEAKGSFLIVIKVKGEGTMLLKKLIPGTEVPVLGPLGNGIDFSEFDSIGLLVRGVGSAAVTFLARRAYEKGVKVIAFVSATTGNRLVALDILSAYCSEVFVATDDRSTGTHDDARVLADRYLQKSRLQALYTCGSRRFARYTENLDTRGACRGFVFLEGYMACGVGNCHGCAVKKRNEEGFYLVCKEGPVFPITKVVLE